MRHFRQSGRRTGVTFSLLTALILALVSVTASPGQAADRDRVRAFLTVTGFDVALEAIKLSAEDAPAMLGIRAQDFGLSWTRLAGEVFDVALMQEMGVDILERTLSDAALAHAAGFYASDLGQRLVQAENASHLADRSVKRKSGEEMIADLMVSDPERVAIFDRMMRAIGSAEMTLKSANEVQIRFLMAAAAAGIVELKLDEKGLRALQAESAEESLAEIRKSGLRGAAVTYDGISNEDLAAYAEALEQPLMREVYELMDAVQFEIMANRYEAVAMRLRGLDPGQEL
ncbi:MAG: DUF2059 domain-containing protein [Pseudooceanicola sp.]|nr:DUF2059 domain-containing protein [Pseudooceanicola sp.]